MNEDLERIKKKYGEEMMHFCHANFPTLLETEGLLPGILESKFYPSHRLYKDIKSNNDINSFINIIMKENKKDDPGVEKTEKTAKELMSEAGYDLYECRSEEDIQSFKKYYKAGEQLCTFHGGRLNTDHVFFAVKKNVDDIKREDFPNPERQDEYGTSVISIQFSKKDAHLSIKNRYNHTVRNCDSTFSNNLDNIIPGLTDAFERDYKMKEIIYTGDEITGYVMANNGKYYKNNLEINNIIYSRDNIIIDNGEVKKIDPTTCMVIDYFILDKKNKTIKAYAELYDGLIEGLDEDEIDDVIFEDGLIEAIGEIDEVKEKKIDGGKEITIINKKGETTILKLNEENNLTEFTNNDIKYIGNYFAYYCPYLEKFTASNLKEVDDYFMGDNETLKILNTPLLEKVGSNFAYNCQVEEFSAPNLKEVLDNFMGANESLKFLNVPSLEITSGDFACSCQVEEFSAPNLKEVDYNFMSDNESLKILNTPSLEKVGFCFANYSQVEEFNAPNLKEVGNKFMVKNELLKILNIPLVEKVGENFAENCQVEEFNVPNLKEVGHKFMAKNELLKILNTPLLEKVGANFGFNCQVEEFNAPNLKEVDRRFMANNKSLKILNTPSLEEVEWDFAENCQVEEFNAPNLEKADDNFMAFNESLKILNTPLLEKVGDNFACSCQVEEFNAPNLKEVGDGFMIDNERLKILNTPSLEKVGWEFAYNCQVEEFRAPNLKLIFGGFMENNHVLKNLYISKNENEESVNKSK